MILDQVYVLVNTVLGKPISVHTTEQGATEDMATLTASEQRYLEVFPVRMVNDDD